MSKLRPITAVALAFLVIPAFAAAAPTATHITTPAADPAFVTVDPELPQSLQIEGTATGDGDVDIRCYHGSTSTQIAGPVAVSGGTFAVSVPLDQPLLWSLGYPAPFCTLRAVPSNTTPAAPPGAPSDWTGPSIGWGEQSLYRVGAGFDPTPPETVWDYELEIAQSKAFNLIDSATSCGLCDTYLFDPETKAISNGIWYVNAGIFRTPEGIGDRAGLIIDGKPAYSASMAHWAPGNLGDNAGLPLLSVSKSVDPATGDITADEHTELKRCDPEPATFPSTSVSCTSFADSGVVLDRHVHITDDGMLVTFVDHWKSVDNQPHQLDAIYEDSEYSENGKTSGHEGRVDFTWTRGGFKSYGPNENIALPDETPATILVKTDASTPDNGDHMNPFGAVIYSTRPSELNVLTVGRTGDQVGRWHARYTRSVPAGGEVVISTSYTHDFTLAGMTARAEKAGYRPLPAVSDQPAPDPAPAPADASSPTPTPQSVPAGVTPKTPVCVVPKLRGKSLAMGKVLLKKAHCRLGKVSHKVSKNVKPGRIVATRFKVGSRHPVGARVRVTIATKARAR